MHLPPAAALRHFEQQPRPRPRLLPAGGRGSGKEVEGIEFLQQMGPFRQDSVPWSTFHIPSLSRICKPAPTTRKACWLPNNSPQLTNTHSQAPDTCTEGLSNLQSGGTLHVHLRQQSQSDPTPTICRWCQRLQFATRFKFMVNRYFALPVQLLPNFTDEGFYTLQSRFK